jgi:hypothetical protein
MAIISIPTSIGGVSIPGGSVNGPLGALFGNNFGRSDLHYPRDLQSATRGHAIKFDIFEVQPASYQDLKNTVIGFANKGAEAVTQGLNAVKDATTSWDAAQSAVGDAFTKTANSIENFIDNPNSINDALNFTQPKQVPAGSISLYIPETINFTYNASYENMSAVAAAAQVPGIGNIVKPIAQVLESGPAKLLLRGQGYAFNPQQQVLFDGIDFRTYQMVFTFTPYSKQEAKMVEDIIKLFKYHSAPRLATGGMFFVPPSIFVPKFLFNGAENPHINKIAKSVITGFNVDYAPAGFATNTDGSAVQIQVMIDFKEIELITRDKIQNGY